MKSGALTQRGAINIWLRNATHNTVLQCQTVKCVGVMEQLYIYIVDKTAIRTVVEQLPLIEFVDYCDTYNV